MKKYFCFLLIGMLSMIQLTGCKSKETTVEEGKGDALGENPLTSIYNGELEYYTACS